MTFFGTEIARVNSDDGNKGRWTELILWKKQNGGYVVQRLGRSIVYHDPKCHKITGRTDGLLPVDEPDPSTETYACEFCDPDRNKEPVLMETDKIWAKSADDAEWLERVLRSPIRYTREVGLSYLARTLLNNAAKEDEAIEKVLHAIGR